MIPSIEQEIRDLHELLGSSRDPEGRAFVPLADAYRRSGDPARALELLRRGTERHPSLAAGHLVLAWTCRDLADDASAEAAFREVLALDGDNARALVGLGRLLEGRDDVGESERLIQRGLALDPRLASEGTPDRVPRHSGNPEVVGVDALAPLEWEVIEPEPDLTHTPPPDSGAAEGEAVAAEGSEVDSGGGAAGLVDDRDVPIVDAADLAPDPPTEPAPASEPATPVAPDEAMRAVESVESAVADEIAGAHGSAEAGAPAEAVDEAVGVDIEAPAAAVVATTPDPGLPVDGRESGAAALAATPTEPLEEPPVDAEPSEPSEVGDGMVPLEAAEAALLASLDQEPSLPATEWADDEIDIEWEVEGFYDSASPASESPDPPRATSASPLSVDDPRPTDDPPPADDPALEAADARLGVGPAEHADRFIEALSAAQPEPHVAATEDPVIDPWDPSPGATADEGEAESADGDVVSLYGAEVGSEAGEEVMSLYGGQVAPASDDDVVSLRDHDPASGFDDDGRADEEVALPTRTLGELYARQGLTGEAIKVFEQLVARDPDNSAHRQRLEELRAQWSRGPGGRSPDTEGVDTPPRAVPTIDVELDADDEPAVSGFFDDLLGWEPSSDRDGPG